MLVDLRRFGTRPGNGCWTLLIAKRVCDEEDDGCVGVLGMFLERRHGALSRCRQCGFLLCSKAWIFNTIPTALDPAL